MFLGLLIDFAERRFNWFAMSALIDIYDLVGLRYGSKSMPIRESYIPKIEIALSCFRIWFESPYTFLKNVDFWVGFKSLSLKDDDTPNIFHYCWYQNS